MYTSMRKIPCEYVEKHQMVFAIFLEVFGINEQNQRHKQIIDVYLFNFDWRESLAIRVGESFFGWVVDSLRVRHWQYLEGCLLWNRVAGAKCCIFSALTQDGKCLKQMIASRDKLGSFLWMTPFHSCQSTVSLYILKNGSRLLVAKIGFG